MSTRKDWNGGILEGRSVEFQFLWFSKMQRPITEPVGDPDATVKLFEILRGRYTEQFEKFHKELHKRQLDKMHLHGLALFGIMGS